MGFSTGVQMTESSKYVEQERRVVALHCSTNVQFLGFRQACVDNVAHDLLATGHLSLEARL